MFLWPIRKSSLQDFMEPISSLKSPFSISTLNLLTLVTNSRAGKLNDVTEAVSPAKDNRPIRRIDGSRSWSKTIPDVAPVPPNSTARVSQDPLTCHSSHKGAIGLLKHLAAVHPNDEEVRNTVLLIAHDWMWQSEMIAWGVYHDLCE